MAFSRGTTCPLWCDPKVLHDPFAQIAKALSHGRLTLTARNPFNSAFGKKPRVARSRLAAERALRVQEPPPEDLFECGVIPTLFRENAVGSPRIDAIRLKRHVSVF